MIPAATYNASLEEQQGSNYQNNNFYLYDKTVVFGNIPINRDIIHLRNLNMWRDIKKGYEIKNPTTNRTYKSEGIKIKVEEEYLKKLEKQKKRDANIYHYSSSSYGLLTSRPLGFNFSEMVYYLYNVNGFYGKASSSVPIILEGAIFLFLCFIFGFTLMGTLMAMITTALIVAALSAALNIGSTGGGQLCLRVLKFQYQQIKEKWMGGKSYFYNRLKYLEDPKDREKIYSVLTFNGMKSEDFLDKYQDRTIASSHPRPFGIVTTSVFTPRVDTKKEKFDERAKILKEFAKEKYNKLKETKAFEETALDKSQKVEDMSIDTLNLQTDKIILSGRKNGLQMRMDFGNCLVRRMKDFKTYYKGYEYYKGMNTLKRKTHSTIYYPDIRITVVGFLGAASTDSNFPLLYSGGLLFDKKDFLIFATAGLTLEDPVFDLIPNIIEYIFSCGIMVGGLSSKNNSKDQKVDVLENRAYFFPKIKTEDGLFGLGTNKCEPCCSCVG